MTNAAPLSLALGRWAWIALWVASGTVLLTDANRFLPPSGEKFADRVAGGGSDLLPSFNAAYALLDGQNPYHYVLEQLPARPIVPNYTYQYPPTHFLIYVPVVWYAGTNFEIAARIQFFLELIVAALLALALVDLSASAIPIDANLRYALVPIVATVLILNPGNQLGLERGQSDVITSALCWSAAALFQRRSYALAIFLAVTGALLKGYGTPFAAGLLLLCMRPGIWRRALLSALAALALLLAPVARFLPDAYQAYLTRARMFWSFWNNQSLYNLIYTVHPRFAHVGRHVAIGIACAVMLLALLRLGATLRNGSQQDQASALIMYTTAALIFILSFSLNSLAYTSVLILPGALALAITQKQLLRRPTPLRAALLGGWLTLALFGLCAMSLPRTFGLTPHAPELPVHALGQVGLLVLIAIVATRDLLAAR